MKLVPVALAIAGALALGTWSASAPRAADAKAAIPPFTAAQVSRGQSDYYANCAKCHGAQLEGISGPALVGSDSNLQLQQLKAVYTYTIGQMPVGNAGGLPQRDYVDIMAFILSKHHHAASSTELTARAAQASSALLGR